MDTSGSKDMAVPNQVSNLTLSKVIPVNAMPNRDFFFRKEMVALQKFEKGKRLCKWLLRYGDFKKYPFFSISRVGGGGGFLIGILRY